MAKAARDMEEFKAANGSVGGAWEPEKKDSDSAAPKSDEQRTPSPNPPLFVSPPPPGAIAPVTARYRTIDYSKYSKHSGFQASSGEAEIKRRRRMAKYQKYAAESGVKTSFRNGFQWMKTKYCQLVHGY